MKRRMILMGVALAAMICLSPLGSAAEPATPPCGGGQCGAGCLLTPEQKAERQQAMQQYLAGLRAKKANGTITPAEQACLDRMEQAGGLCVNGVPRGPRGGFGAQAQQGSGRGQGQGLGYGRAQGQGGGLRHGWCGGAGPGANGNCPAAATAPAR